MSVKKFVLPQIFVAFTLILMGMTGIDTIIHTDGNDKVNIQKYFQVQQRIYTNYVDEVDLNELYKSSIRAIIRHLDDSTLVLENTPLDTNFVDLDIDNTLMAARGFEQAYLYTQQLKPETDMTKLTEAAIRGMFTDLDPHSIYIEPKESERIQEDFAGKFQGIGVQFNILNDTITVITAISGGPSAELGIQSGDRIVEIDGESAVGFKDNEEVVKRLRGAKGTPVDVVIIRPSEPQPLNFTIIRDDIPIVTVDTSYMLDDKTGYIKVNRFAATTHQEFMAAVRDLGKEGMNRLVLDLRGNPGGFMSQAIAISEEFLTKGATVVATESRHPQFTDEALSRRNGNLSDTPLIVLVDEGSASASEIVSGAVQDHDRGLIVGKRTFGKGLVQQQYRLVDNSNIRVTISKYLTPSGRLIQKPYKDGRESYAYEIYERRFKDSKTDVQDFIQHVPDSLKYSTDAGRAVYGGGGIIPDHIIARDTTKNFSVLNYGTRKRIIFNYVRQYIDNNGDDIRAKWENDFQAFRSNFEWNDKQQDEIFEAYLENGMVLSDTLDVPKYKHFTDSTFVNEADTSYWKYESSDTLYVPKKFYDENEWMVLGSAKSEVAKQIWDFSYFWQVYNDIFDETLKKSMELWPEVNALHEFSLNHQSDKIEGVNDIRKMDK